MRRNPCRPILIIDGYCYLDTAQSPGLGANLAKTLQTPMAIVGVAKNQYRRSEHAIPVTRGESSRPLYITAIGMRDKAMSLY